MADTLTDIHAAVGDLLNADTETDANADDTIDAELDAKASELEEPEAEEIEAAEEPAADVETEEVAAEAPDPFAAALESAQPFGYTVDGQAKTYDGIKVTADGRAIVPKESIPDLQYRLQRGEYLETQNKALYEKARDFDAVTVQDRASGTEHTGMAAIEHLVVENARQHAALQLMADYLENPDKLIPLAIAVQNGDTSAIQTITDRLRLMAENVSYKTKASFSQRMTSARETDAHALDRATVTPQAISSAVEHWATQYPALTAQDKQHAIQHLTKIGATIVRPATPDEATAAGVKPGQLIIDHPVVEAYLSDRAAWRQEQARSTTAVSTAAKENAARLAATKAPKRAATPTKAKAKTQAPDDTEETWAQQKARMNAGILGAPGYDDE